MTPSILDRMIAAVAPLHGRNRLLAKAQFEALTEGAPIVGAHDARSPARRFWRPVARDARSDTLATLNFDRAASRELVRTSAIAAGAVRTNVDRIVGTGLALVAQPHTDVLGWTADEAAAWKSKVQAEFSLWADRTDCDQYAEQNFYELQALALRSTLESGDCFTLLPDGAATATQPYRLRIQLLEADRIGSDFLGLDKNIAAGVKLDPATGAPVAYRVLKEHPGSLVASQEGEWVERIGQSGRIRILHHYLKRRPGQLRGVPYLAPVVDCIKQISRYSEAEITAAVLSAYLMLAIETQTGDAAPMLAGDVDNLPEGSLDIPMAPGAAFALAPGEKANLLNPGRPNPNFEPFVAGVLKQIGMALGLPYELLMKQFNSSYTASKAALLDAWIYFRGMRYWLSGSFCQPIYETWLAEAVATGRVNAPGFFRDPLLRWAYSRAAWHGDSMGALDPQREVAAYTAAIDQRLMTRERAEWELFGTDWNETFAQKAAEQSRLKAAELLPEPKAGAAAPGQRPSDGTPDNKAKP